MGLFFNRYAPLGCLVWAAQRTVTSLARWWALQEPYRLPSRRHSWAAANTAHALPGCSHRRIHRFVVMAGALTQDYARVDASDLFTLGFILLCAPATKATLQIMTIPREIGQAEYFVGMMNIYSRDSTCW